MKKLFILLSLLVSSVSAFAQEQTDEHGIIIQPAQGEEIVYTRSGTVLYPVGFDISEGYQSGEVRVVYCEDGTVYMHHPLEGTLEHNHFQITSSWIKGTISDDKLIFSPQQPISWSNGWRCAIYLAMGDMTNSTSGSAMSVPSKDEDIVFSIHNNRSILQLDNSSHDHTLGAYYAVDDDCCTHWDYNTVLFHESEHDPAVVLPAGLEAMDYIITGYDDKIGGVSYTAKIAFDGDDVYLGSFCYYAADCWIKGHRQGSDLVFPSGQYLKTLDYDVLTFYCLPNNCNDATPIDLVLSYDDESGYYYNSESDIFISSGEITIPLARVERISDFTLIPLGTTSANVITETPEGTRKRYNREGRSVGYYGAFYWCSQEGETIDIVTAPDGKTIYMQNPILLVSNDVWVKGTIKEDGKIHMPVLQWLQQDELYGNFRTAVLTLENVTGGQTYEVAPNITEVTFSIDSNGVISLDPIAEDDDPSADIPPYLYGVVSAETLEWIGFGDMECVYIPTDINVNDDDNDDDHGTDDLVNQKPDPSLEYQYYILSGTDVTEGPVSYNAKMAFDGDVVWLGAFCFWASYDEDLWIKGHKDGNTIVFPKEQYLSTYMGYDMWFYASYENQGGYSACDLTLTLDPQTGKYTSKQHIFITWYKATTSMNRAEEITGVVLTPDGSNGAPIIIHNTPEGELKTYSRAGVGYGYNDNGQVQLFDQSQNGATVLNMVYHPDGKTVFMQNPVSQAVNGAWVKGYKGDDGKLHFPVLQWVDYNDAFGYGIRTAVLLRNDNSYIMVSNITEVTYTVDANGVISLDRIEGVNYDGDRPAILYGLVYSDALDWSGYGDLDSVYTPTGDHNGIESVAADSKSAATYYDLFGRKVSPATRGLIIHNGTKKIFR
ncbi:MAG: hypothetical protein KBT20_07840 [Bacteroidales bacterium]|nr:hypothetical protein [Candidatus Liminaster caballi]